MPARRLRVICNLVLYQIGWIACVVGAAHGRPEFGLAATGLALVVAIAMSATPRQIVLLALLGIAIGTCVESALLATGQVTYASPGPVPAVPPMWILALWVGLAINANELLGWMHGRPMLQVVFAVLGAPLAYVGGERLGAMTFVEPRALGLALLACLWAVAFPALMAGAKRIGLPSR